MRKKKNDQKKVSRHSALRAKKTGKGKKGKKSAKDPPFGPRFNLVGESLKEKKRGSAGVRVPEGKEPQGSL